MTYTRFWSKVEKTETCWLWLPPTNHAGYGIFWPTNKKRFMAHRWAYETFVGPVPEGLDLDHLCRVRQCVNPAHLEPVTRRENTLRGNSPSVVIRRRGTCDRGHELTADNLANAGNGKVTCRKCHNAWRRRTREKRTA